MNYDEINAKLKKYFCDLLIAEYRCSNKNRAFIEALFNLIFANNLALQLRDGVLNVEESIGKQLDIVGEWVGVDRFYDNSILWNRKYFAFIDWGKVPNVLYQGGFSNYKNFLTLDGYTMTWKHLQESKKALYQLGDNYYRQLIKLKIIKNSIRFTKKNIDDAIYEWSSGQVYTTWDKMSITYHYPSQVSQVIGLAIAKKCLPCPTGCELKTVLI